jgi:hypothetical protein
VLFSSDSCGIEIEFPIIDRPHVDPRGPLFRFLGIGIGEQESKKRTAGINALLLLQTVIFFDSCGIENAQHWVVGQDAAARVDQAVVGSCLLARVSAGNRSICATGLSAAQSLVPPNFLSAASMPAPFVALPDETLAATPICQTEAPAVGAPLDAAAVAEVSTGNDESWLNDVPALEAYSEDDLNPGICSGDSSVSQRDDELMPDALIAAQATDAPAER